VLFLIYTTLFLKKKKKKNVVLGFQVVNSRHFLLDHPWAPFLMLHCIIVCDETVIMMA
jgi:hypothetical protein